MVLSSAELNAADHSMADELFAAIHEDLLKMQAECGLESILEQPCVPRQSQS